MPSIQGVEAYVKKTYRQREEKLRQIEVQVRAAMGSKAGLELLGQIKEACLLSQDLGSMRRLLGDLRSQEGLQSKGLPGSEP